MAFRDGSEMLYAQFPSPLSAPGWGIVKDMTVEELAGVISMLENQSSGSRVPALKKLRNTLRRRGLSKPEELPYKDIDRIARTS